MLSLLRILIRESRGLVAVAIASGAIAGIAGVALIALIQAQLARSDGPSMRSAGAFAALVLVALAARVASQSALVRLGQAATTGLGLRLARSILALPLEKFERSDPSALLAVLTGDLGLIGQALVGLPEVCINGPVVVACLAYVGWLSPPVLACGVVLGAAAVAAYVWLSARALERLREARSGQERMIGQFRTLIEGFRELRQHRRRRSAFLDESLAPTAAKLRDESVAGMTAYALAEGWGELAFFCVLGLILFALPVAGALDRATLTGVTLVVLYLMGPIGVLISWLPTLARARASVARIRELIPSLEAQAVDDRPGRAFGAFGSVRLEGVSYAYRPDVDGSEGFALGPVDLEFRPGEAVLLAGGNGSGKTTLMKVVAGLYEPQSGAILVDGVPVGPEDRESYRQLVSVVFADGFLFRELLGLDADGLDRRAGEGLERLGLADRVRVEGGAFSTVELSQGQRRRLALLTALLEDRPLCIFDEWAANQDPRFKRDFYRELIPELKARGKAVLIISHDEAYFDSADRLIRLEEGRVVEDERAIAAAEGGLL